MHFTDFLYKKGMIIKGESMEGPYFQPETFMRLTFSLVYDCINVWIIIKCGMASFIGLACMCCLHCTCMQLCENSKWMTSSKMAADQSEEDLHKNLK